MPVPYPQQQITALLLAGGRGRRMGGLDKGLAPYGGEPMAAHIARALSGQAQRLLLSANRSHTAYRAIGLDPIPDARRDYPGPLAGIETALAHCSTPYLLICPCDTPHVPTDLGPRLWRALASGDHQVCHARSPTRDHYLHLLMRAELADGLTRYLDAGGRAVRHWLADLSVTTALFDEAELANLNTLETLPANTPAPTDPDG